MLTLARHICSARRLSIEHALGAALLRLFDESLDFIQVARPLLNTLWSDPIHVSCACPSSDQPSGSARCMRHDVRLGGATFHPPSPAPLPDPAPSSFLLVPFPLPLPLPHSSRLHLASSAFSLHPPHNISCSPALFSILPPRLSTLFPSPSHPFLRLPCSSSVLLRFALLRPAPRPLPPPFSADARMWLLFLSRLAL